MLSLDAVERLAARASLDPENLAALRPLLTRLSGDPAARARFDAHLTLLTTLPAKEAVAALSVEDLEAVLGDDALRYYLLLALHQLPAADERHAKHGISPDISRATWRDLALWSTHLRARSGLPGLTLELLGWAQTYLRGELVRLGMLQFEPVAFQGPVVVLRNRETRALRAIMRPGIHLANDGRAVVPEPRGDTWTTGGDLEGAHLVGHPVDPETGAASRSVVTIATDEWNPVVTAGTPLLEMHLPGDGRVELTEFSASFRAGFAFFAARSPVGVSGGAWLLDPQVREILPHNLGVAAWQSACTLFPGTIPEAKTVRRIFGPRATRASVRTLPREGMNSLQRAVATFLDDPSKVLCGMGGVILMDEITQVMAALEGG